MRVLITGGGGYIGTVLTNYLLSLGFKITVVDKFLFGNFLKRHKNLKIIKRVKNQKLVLKIFKVLFILQISLMTQQVF